VNEKFEEFKQQCLEGDGAKRLEMTARREEAERFRNQSDYHLQAARDLLDGEASLIAIVEGYYSMLHRSNQALAMQGSRPHPTNARYSDSEQYSRAPISPENSRKP
jgi:hypothetical protein